MLSSDCPVKVHAKSAKGFREVRKGKFLCVLCANLSVLCVKLLLSFPANGQELITNKLQFTQTAPAELLAMKSVVFYDQAYEPDELAEIQKYFQQTGIDAVAYFETDKVLAGKDPAKVHADYFVSRDIRFIVLLLRPQGEYDFMATTFNGKADFVDDGQPAWRVQNAKLRELLQTVFRDSWLTQKKMNFLINDVPEMNISLNPIAGRRSEFYPIDLKVDNLAVIRSGNASDDQQIESFFSSYYPYKYKITDPVADDKELRKQGFHYVLSFVRSRGSVLKELLGYDMTKSESAYLSVTYPNGVSQLKTISAERVVYKFYFKHIESGNVFLGTKWDADDTYFQASKNLVQGFRTELKLN